MPQAKSYNSTLGGWGTTENASPGIQAPPAFISLSCKEQVAPPLALVVLAFGGWGKRGGGGGGGTHQCSRPHVAR